MKKSEIYIIEKNNDKNLFVKRVELDDDSKTMEIKEVPFLISDKEWWTLDIKNKGELDKFLSVLNEGHEDKIGMEDIAIIGGYIGGENISKLSLIPDVKELESEFCDIIVNTPRFCVSKKNWDTYNLKSYDDVKEILELDENQCNVDRLGEKIQEVKVTNNEDECAIQSKKHKVRELIKSELDAIMEYESALYMFNDEEKEIIKEIASDEKEHVGLLSALLGKIDSSEDDDFLKGMEELNEILEESVSKEEKEVIKELKEEENDEEEDVEELVEEDLVV